MPSHASPALAQPGPYGQLIQNTYRLTNGYVSVRFNSGAETLIEAPSEFTILNENAMDFQGVLSANVPPSGYGFLYGAGAAGVFGTGTPVTEAAHQVLNAMEGK